MVHQKEYTPIVGPNDDKKKFGISFKIFSAVAATIALSSGGYHVLQSNGSPQDVSLTSNVLRSSSGLQLRHPYPCPPDFVGCHGEGTRCGPHHFYCEPQDKCLPLRSDTINCPVIYVPEVLPVDDGGASLTTNLIDSSNNKFLLSKHKYGCMVDCDCDDGNICSEHKICVACKGLGCGATDCFGCNHDGGEFWCESKSKCLPPGSDTTNCPVV